MKLKDIFNIKNIESFLEGNTVYLYDKLVGMPKHYKEQVAYRLQICQEDCVSTGKCKECGCPTRKKVFVRESCNKGERFPDLMPPDQWEEYKKNNDIS